MQDCYLSNISTLVYIPCNPGNVKNSSTLFSYLALFSGHLLKFRIHSEDYISLLHVDSSAVKANGGSFESNGGQLQLACSTAFYIAYL